MLGDSTTMFPLSCVCFNGDVCCTRGDVFLLLFLCCKKTEGSFLRNVIKSLKSVNMRDFNSELYVSEFSVLTI